MPDTWARGRVAELYTQRNVRGLPWVSFHLLTGAGSLRCVCFPRTYASVSRLLRVDRQVELRGKPMRENALRRAVLDVYAVPPV